MKSRLIVAALVSAVPFGGPRRWLYRTLLGYQIDRSASIGWLTVIAVSKCTLGPKVRIGSLNIFKGPMTVTIGARSRIGRFNEFTSNWKIVDDRFAHMRYTPELQLGEGCLILHQHYFDVYGRLIMGDGSWVAGVRSQFWTHGVSVMDRDIIIGRDNYIGTGVMFAPGSGIGDGNLVAMGAVVTGRVDATDSIIGGSPASVLRSITEQKRAGKYRFSFDDWAD